jgi:hypothetical protein
VSYLKAPAAHFAEPRAVPMNDLPHNVLRGVANALEDRYPGEIWRYRGELRRLDGAGFLAPISAAQLAALVPSAAYLADLDDGKSKIKRVPYPIVRDLYYWPEFGPALTSVVRAPWADRAGHVYRQHGYHAGPGVFLHAPGLDVDPGAVSATDARYVLSRLLDAEFGGPLDRASALAAYLHPVRGPALYGAPSPLYLIHADRPECGKTYLARMISIIATGQEPPTNTLPTSAQEMRYTIGTLLNKSPALVFFDNVGTGERVGNADLHALLTASADLSSRKIGSSEEIGGNPTHSQWLATMNQPRVDAEQARRTVPIRLLPRARGFTEPDLIEWTHHNRELCLSVLLRLLVDWHGARPMARALPSYERWSELVGSPAIHTYPEAAADWLTPRHRLAPAGHKEFAALAGVWPRVSGDLQPLTASAIVELVDASGLHELADLAGPGNAKSRATRLGRALTRQVRANITTMGIRWISTFARGHRKFAPVLPMEGIPEETKVPPEHEQHEQPFWGPCPPKQCKPRGVNCPGFHQIIGRTPGKPESG